MNQLNEALKSPGMTIAATFAGAGVDSVELCFAATAAQVAELRVDALSSYDKSYVLSQVALCASKLPVLATPRSIDEAGPTYGWRDSEADRLQMYEALATSPNVQGMDCELAADILPEVVALAQDNDQVVLASAHYHEAMPTRDRLEADLEAAYRAADGYEGLYLKVAAKAETQADYLTLTAFTEHHAGENIATVAMGKFGPLSRFVLASLGSCITYGYPGDDPAASGQVQVRELAAFRAAHYPDEV